MKNLQRLFALFMFGISVYFFYQSYIEYRPFKDAAEKNTAIQKVVVKNKEAEDPMDRKIDFELLQNINEEIIGWLYCPQINVDQPILKGSDDQKYLQKDFEGKYDPLGSIFTFARTDSKLVDPTICLFGHNMRSGQMFGRLEEFLSPEFLNKNDLIYLYTPERTKVLKVISAEVRLSSDDVFQEGWMDESNRQTVILSTCDGYTATKNRIIVMCKTQEEKLVL